MKEKLSSGRDSWLHKVLGINDRWGHIPKQDIYATPLRNITEEKECKNQKLGEGLIQCWVRHSHCDANLTAATKSHWVCVRMGPSTRQVWMEEGLGGHSLANELFGTDRSREKMVMTFSCVSPSDPTRLQRIISIQCSYWWPWLSQRVIKWNQKSGICKRDCVVVWITAPTGS